jgi:hypothetical protein
MKIGSLLANFYWRIKPYLMNAMKDLKQFNTFNTKNRQREGNRIPSFKINFLT